MKRLYFSLLVWLGMSAVLLMVSANYLIHVFLPMEMAVSQRIHHLVELFDEGARHHSQDYAERLAYSTAEVNFYHLTAMPLDDPRIPESVRSSIADGNLLVWGVGSDEGYLTFGDRQTIYYAVPAADIQWLNRVFLALVFAGVALACLVWVVLLRRRIRKLEATTDAFANGDLDARASIAGRDRLGELNVHFNDMATKISTLLASHKQLTNAIAHEMRTPLFRLKCQLELLGDSGQSATQNKYIAGMQDDVDEMNDMTEELLHYARLERSTIADRWESVDPADFMAGLVTKLEREQVDCTLDVELAPSLPAVSINRVDMERAIGNVVRNALKYSNSKVTVAVTAQDGVVQCLVDDDGPGVPSASRERIFEPFARLASARDRASGGHGLGLAIAQQILQRHRGSIRCNESPLGGARFRISFPIAALGTPGQDPTAA